MSSAGTLRKYDDYYRGKTILVTGVAGVKGSWLVHSLLRAGASVIGVDVVAPPPDSNFSAAGLKDSIEFIKGDVADTGLMRSVVNRVDGVFHLAAVVSGQAEADFDLGMQVNLEGTRTVLEACRALPQAPRLVFPSSVAVFGGAMPEVIGDDTLPTPQTSYGAQKAVCE